MLLLPIPEGLPRDGQRALAVAALAVGLWGTETLPAGVTGVVVVSHSWSSGPCPACARR